jgi:hypothetical protein
MTESMRLVLSGLIRQCREMADTVEVAQQSFANHIDDTEMRGVIGELFRASTDEAGLYPLAKTAAILAAAADNRRLGLGKSVAEAFIANTDSAAELALFRESYTRVCTSCLFRLHADWIAQATLLRAAVVGNDCLDALIELVPGTCVSELVYAATGTRLISAHAQGWAAAVADPVRRSLVRSAFEDKRVKPFAGRGGPSMAELMDWGMRARDAGITDEGALTRFYDRCDADDRGAACDKRLRDWLLDRGASKVTDDLREACVNLAMDRRSS